MLSHAQSCPESPWYICRSTGQSSHGCQRYAVDRQGYTNLLVEHFVVLVDICDIALLLVESLARELAPFVNAR